jgi:threonine dehydratase
MTEQRHGVTKMKTRLPGRTGVLEAAAKIAAILPPTPLLPLELDGVTIWCKAECLQPVGAFKIRGAWHRLSALDLRERMAGVVAFSSGNHAQGIAWAARKLGIHAAIVMPSDAPKPKLDATRALGAEVILYDRRQEGREKIAESLARERGSVLVPSFDDSWVIEGQGSTAIEIAVQMQAQAGIAPGQLVIPCGGGGLASGCALALPGIPIAAVEPEGWTDMGESLVLGRVVPVQDNPVFTSCDALQTKQVSPMTFDILRGAGAMGVAVRESEVEAAMRLAFDRLRVVVEPGGAVGLAALLARKVEAAAGTAVILSGGNVDRSAFAKVIAGG